MRASDFAHFPAPLSSSPLPTGNIGSKVLAGIASTGQLLRLIVRDPAKLPINLPKTVEIVQGRTDNLDTLTRAL